MLIDDPTLPRNVAGPRWRISVLKISPRRTRIDLRVRQPRFDFR
jgi:hypothetical protein